MSEMSEVPRTSEVPTIGVDLGSFYDRIVSITETNAYKSVLIKHTDELYNRLTEGYQDNIKISAENGFSKSIIALFNVRAIYRGKVTVLSMLFPTEKFLRKCKKYNIDPVLERIKKNLQPFEVRYEIMNEHDVAKKHVGAIIVQWKLPVDSDSSDDMVDVPENAGDAGDAGDADHV
jgi:hypothetical protein